MKKQKEREWEVFSQTANLEDFEEPVLEDDPADDDEFDARARKKWAKIKDGICGDEISAIRKDNKHQIKNFNNQHIFLSLFKKD